MLAFYQIIIDGLDGGIYIQAAPDHCGLEYLELVSLIIESETSILWSEFQRGGQVRQISVE